MRKKTIKLLISFIILAAVLISAGCSGDTQSNNDNTNSDNKENTNANSNTNPSPEDENVVAAIYEQMKNDPNLKDQVENVKITYSNKTITLSGFIYGEENLLAFYKILFDVKVPKSSQKDKAKFVQGDDANSEQSNDSRSEDEAVNKIISDDFHWYRNKVGGQCPAGMCECGSSCISCSLDC